MLSPFVTDAAVVARNPPPPLNLLPSPHIPCIVCRLKVDWTATPYQLSRWLLAPKPEWFMSRDHLQTLVWGCQAIVVDIVSVCPGVVKMQEVRQPQCAVTTEWFIWKPPVAHRAVSTVNIAKTSSNLAIFGNERERERTRTRKLYFTRIIV